MLRDAAIQPHGNSKLDQLSHEIKDNNFRVFAENGELHLVSSGLHLNANDPFLLFQKLMDTDPKNMDPAHAFYLGFELSKGLTAETLGKQYEQDQSLDWGFLTRPESHHRLKRGKPDS